MKIRRFRPGDEPALWAVYYSAIHEVACRDYSQAQVEAWAPADIAPAAWARRMQGIQPFVAERDDGEVLGYADVQAHGYIDHFFVAGHHGRQGVGTRLMQRIHEEARRLGLHELSADVSKTAEPFFAHHGFALVERRFPVQRGVTVENALMRKGLD